MVYADKQRQGNQKQDEQRGGHGALLSFRFQAASAPGSPACLPCGQWTAQTQRAQQAKCRKRLELPTCQRGHAVRVNELCQIRRRWPAQSAPATRYRTQRRNIRQTRSFSPSASLSPAGRDAHGYSGNAVRLKRTAAELSMAPPAGPLRARQYARDAVRGGRIKLLPEKERLGFSFVTIFHVKNRAHRSAYFAQNSISWLTIRIATPDACSARKICPNDHRLNSASRPLSARRGSRMSGVRQGFSQCRALLFAAGEVATGDGRGRSPLERGDNLHKALGFAF